ncbi:tripartite tricarboxylate transporter TctB family protein [Roseovarius mucosus]|uniref:tripartite tricarboxylate transporter TctB family protein n=1 Tax=Roseovarius mucosus TaxID=215743 RepID=UPI003F727107
MQRFNIIDAATGLALVVIGIALQAHITASYDLGSLRRMGPGMVPMGLSLLLSGLGAALALSALLRAPAPLPQVQVRPFVFVLAAIAAFSLTIRLFGLVPAVVLLVGLSTLADRDARFGTFLALSAVLATLAFLIFRLGLGMNLPPFRWPF